MHFIFISDLSVLLIRTWDSKSLWTKLLFSQFWRLHSPFHSGFSHTVTARYDKEKYYRVLLNNGVCQSPLVLTVVFLFSVVLHRLQLQVENLLIRIEDDECKFIWRHIWSEPREQVLSQLGKCPGGYQVQQTTLPYQKRNNYCCRY